MISMTKGGLSQTQLGPAGGTFVHPTLSRELPTMLSPPLYCALCSGRCLLPRADLPLPTPRPGGLNLNSETVTTPVPAPDPATWESRWFVLQVSEGLVKPSLHTEPQSEPVSPTVPGTTPSTPLTSRGQAFPPTNKRCVPIHQYCLDCVLTTIRRSMYNNGFSHEENMILAWSIPKWTGHGDWATPLELRNPMTPQSQGFVAGRVRSAYWSGTESQRSRWDRTVEGSHLITSDHVSPEDVGEPSPIPFAAVSRSKQTSRLLKLPDHLLLHIALDLLDIPQVPEDTNANTVSRLLPLKDMTDLLSFLRTCSDLRHLSLPTWLWKRILFDSVSRFKLGILSRWRANPSGVGSTMQLAIALDQAFSEPIEKALSNIGSNMSPTAAGEEDTVAVESPDLSVRDVFHWWAYSDGWRSRRRVWHCVVHACATARDADWW